MLNRIVPALFACIWAIVPIPLCAADPGFLVRLDLGRRADFDRATTLDLKAVYRWENSFYFVVDAGGLGRLDDAALKYRVVDRDPFTTGNYYVDTRRPPTKGLVLGESGTRLLDEIGGATLCKSDQPLLLEERLGGDGPIPMTGEKIPLVYMAPLTVAGATADDPILDTIAVRISQDSVLAYANRMVAFQTRYVYTDSNAAAQEYLKQKLLSFGYTDVKNDTFDVENTPGIGHNIICTKTGTIEPGKVIVVGAHFDSYAWTDPMLSAPGADDNASGTVGVLELARVLAQIPTRKTIVFILFNAEEEWMVGSYYYAQRVAASGMDIELMLNMDMIGHDPDSSWNLLLHTDPTSIGYADLAAQLAQGRTRLLPTVLPNPSASDQLPFYEQGYHIIYAEESVFNHAGYHNDTDQIYRLNLPYWTDVIRMTGMTAYLAAESPAPVEMVELYDVGDGQSLEVRWRPSTAADITGYRVYWGASSGSYTNDVTVSAGDPPSLRLNDLPEGQPCYVTVTAVGTAGRESAVRTEVSLTPQHAPHAPEQALADVEYRRIELSWTPSPDLDFDHYTILRGTDSTTLTVREPSVADTTCTDSIVDGHTRYYYRIAAVDHDGNMGAASDLVSGIPATFDRDILVFDLTASASGDPTEEQQWDVYNTFFAGYDHWYYRYDDYSTPIDKSVLGQYKVVFWLDDDVAWESWPADHGVKMNWFLSHGTGLALIGWQTAAEAIGAGVLYDIFPADVWGGITEADCQGGLGVSGFPSVVFDTSRVRSDWGGKLSDITLLRSIEPPAEVILQYNSAIDDSWREQQPVAMRSSRGDSKVALSTLPLYYMRDADAANLVAALASWFGCTSKAMGDLTGDRIVDVRDVIAEIGIVFTAVPPPTGYERADFNADCTVDVLDVLYIIGHTFMNGPAPQPGCAR